MITRFFAVFLAIPRNVSKLATWTIDPKNGSNYVTPFNRRYLSTGTSLVVTILYRTGAGLYNFVTSYVLGSLVYIFQVATGVVLDLWRANPSYSRWMFRGLCSIVVLVASYAVLVARTAGRVGYAVLMGVIDLFR